MFELRRAEPADMPAAFAIFRRSIIEYIHRIGILDSAEVTDEMLDEAWVQRGPWVEHLWRTAAENWLAVDEDGRPIGWAMSNERDGHLELAFFFVEPGVQSKGLGKALLERAMPVGRGRHRAILATLDPRALSLYLRSGVRYVTGVVDLYGPPSSIEVETDLAFERLERTAAAVELIGGVEQELLGHRRDIDIEL
ncbi:MAG: GNAT family N-acetyltransferase [Chloroflexi bacterium]|nr:GNAT family N-acetyltransferase [Chloroflexota bacterium]